ncbi:Zinc finger CCCH domain-containing protein 67 [Quillaja saponaria]|uniref:Zinc finger CCCH domain-containing protein 67 n=1 Tax=Quillaja saponaria TaxID=32244 RepID=A0AAD7Q4R4_QUISA|nr:Zinc finger CCCH domain-containing protein 67 [Quillaja saponaria]
MRKGSCGYGAQCRFNHSDPTVVEGSNSPNSTPKGEPVGGLNYLPGNHSGESDPLQVSGPSQENEVSWSLPAVSNKQNEYQAESSLKDQDNRNVCTS